MDIVKLKDENAIEAMQNHVERALDDPRNSETDRRENYDVPRRHSSLG